MHSNQGTIAAISRPYIPKNSIPKNLHKRKSVTNQEMSRLPTPMGNNDRHQTVSSCLLILYNSIISFLSINRSPFLIVFPDILNNNAEEMSSPSPL